MASIRQQIMTAMDTRLKTILVANGYETNLGQKVYAWKATPLDDVDLPALEYRDIANDRLEGGPIGKFRWALTIEIGIVAASASTTIADVRKMLNDVYKAMGTDETWSTLAQWTEQPSDKVEIEQQDKIIGGAKILFNIVYDAPKWQN